MVKASESVFTQSVNASDVPLMVLSLVARRVVNCLLNSMVQPFVLMAVFPLNKMLTLLDDFFMTCRRGYCSLVELYR